MIQSVYWYAEISIFNPQTRYFSKTYIFDFLEKLILGGVRSKNEILKKWRYKYEENRTRTHEMQETYFPPFFRPPGRAQLN